MKDPYFELREKWDCFWQDLRSIPVGEFSVKKEEILRSFSLISELGSSLQNRVSLDISGLARDLEMLLDGKLSLAQVASLMDRALHVEQETREL